MSTEVEIEVQELMDIEGPFKNYLVLAYKGDLLKGKLVKRGRDIYAVNSEMEVRIDSTDGRSKFSGRRRDPHVTTAGVAYELWENEGLEEGVILANPNKHGRSYVQSYAKLVSVAEQRPDFPRDILRVISHFTSYKILKELFLQKKIGLDTIRGFLAETQPERAFIAHAMEKKLILPGEVPPALKVWTETYIDRQINTDSLDIPEPEPPHFVPIGDEESPTPLLRGKKRKVLDMRTPINLSMERYPKIAKWGVGLF